MKTKTSVGISKEMKGMIAKSMDSTFEENLLNKTPSETAVLVLNTKPFAAKPLVFDLNGKFKKLTNYWNIYLGNYNMDVDFTYENLTQAFFGCAARLGEDYFYFGGVGADSNQVID